MPYAKRDRSEVEALTGQAPRARGRARGRRDLRLAPDHRAPRASSSGRSVSALTGRATPRSVTSAVMRLAGVTSKAGLRTGVSGSASAAPPAWRTSSGARSSMAIAAPVGVAGSIEEVGPGDHERDARGGRGQRQRVRADLVGDVAVGGHAVAADDHGVDLAAGDQPGRGASRRRARARPRPGAAPTWSAARPAGAGGSRVASTRTSSAARGSRPVRCRGRRRPARRCCSG